MVKIGWKNSQIIGCLKQVYGDRAATATATITIAITAAAATTLAAAIAVSHWLHCHRRKCHHYVDRASLFVEEPKGEGRRSYEKGTVTI